MTILGTGLAAMGILFGVWGEWIILKSAFHRGLGTLFTCLALPCGTWLFAVLDMRRPQLALVLSLGGALLMGVGCAMLGAAGVEMTTE